MPASWRSRRRARRNCVTGRASCASASAALETEINAIDREDGVLRLALIGYGNVGQAFARLLEKKRAVYPFRIVATHTARHGTAYERRALPLEPKFGPAAAIDRRVSGCSARPEVVDRADHAESGIRRAGDHSYPRGIPTRRARGHCQQRARRACLRGAGGGGTLLPASSSATSPPAWTARRCSTWSATTCRA